MSFPRPIATTREATGMPTGRLAVWWVIASEIVIWAFILVFGALCLALALAFGLGGREVAGRFLEKWLEQKKNE